MSPDWKETRGRIAVFAEQGFPSSRGGIEPEFAFSALRQYGFSVEYLGYEQLIEGKTLNRSRYDAILLPYGPNFPIKAKRPFLSFLQSGGGFVSIGGYAFDSLVVKSGDGSWRVLTEEEAALPDNRINARYGYPQDDLAISDEQIGVFDPCYRLENVACINAAPEQQIIPADFSCPGPVTGFAACANHLGGSDSTNRGRWQALLDAYDRFGRLRGPAGALIYNYAGMFRGSAWAFIGAESKAIFSEEIPGSSLALARLIEAVVAPFFLHEIRARYAYYEVGETVQISVKVSNHAPYARRCDLAFLFRDVESGQELERIQRSGTLEGRSTTTCVIQWSVPNPSPSTIEVTAVLASGGKTIDRIDSGFIVGNDFEIAQGPPVKFEDNYFHIWDRPTFIFGTAQSGIEFRSDMQNPLTWRRDLAMARDLGVQQLQNLQFFSHFKPAFERAKKTIAALGEATDETGNELISDELVWSEEQLRQMAAMIQLTQKYRIVYMPGLLINLTTSGSDVELAIQANLTCSFAEKFRHVPGLIYYLNGDYSIDWDESTRRLLGKFLRRRYQTTKNLQQAWTLRPPNGELTNVASLDRSDSWEDLRDVDDSLFNVELMLRWNSYHVSRIVQIDQLHPIASEFYWTLDATDEILGIDGLSFGNISYFRAIREDINDFPHLFKFHDLRAKGKGMTIGEWGAKTHPSFRKELNPGIFSWHEARTEEEAKTLYYLLPHYVLGLGGARAANWCWQDYQESVFPWGLTHSNRPVPKGIGYIYRNLSWLFRQFPLKWEAPSTYVMIPDSHRLGGGRQRVFKALEGCFKALSETQIDYGVINEFDIDRLPESVDVLFCPIPFVLSDNAYGKLVDFVKRGGILYISGDFSYDETRKRTQTHRLVELAGVESVKERYPNIQYQDTEPIRVGSDNAKLGWDGYPAIEVRSCGAKTRITAVDGRGIGFHNQFGEGQVIFVADPIELHTTENHKEGLFELYQWVLDQASSKPVDITPRERWLYAYRVPTSDGGEVMVAVNREDGLKTQVTLGCSPRVSVELEPNQAALGYVDGQGRLLTVEGNGSITEDGQRIIYADGPVAVTSLDGLGLSASRAVCLVPLGVTEIEVFGKSRWLNPMVLAGDIVNGYWQTLEEHPIEDMRDSIRLTVAEDTRWDLIVIAEGDTVNCWCDQVALWLRDPQEAFGDINLSL